MDYNEIKKIIQDMGESKLDTLEIEFPDGLKIKMDKGKNESIAVDSNKNIENIQYNEIENKQNEEYKIVKSPMVGTFYSKSKH